MAWEAISTDDVKDRLGSSSYTAVETQALKDGQDDPWPDIIADGVEAVRGAILGNRRNRLGPAGTIPTGCKRHAISWMIWDGLNRFNLSRLLTKGRTTANERADDYFDKVAGGKIGIEEPDDYSDESAQDQPGGFEAVDVETSTKRTATRGKMKGL